MTEQRRNKAVETVVEDVTGVDFRFPRTIWATLRHPVGVARDAFEGDPRRYTSPLRLFMVLFGLQVAIMGVFKIQDAQAPSAILTPEALAVFEANLKDGVTLAEADEDYNRWFNILLLPVAVVTSLPFIFLFKAFNPALRWSAHVAIYLVSLNASYLAGFLALPALVAGPTGAMFMSVVSIVAWLAYFWPLIRAYLASTTLGAMLKMTLSVVLVAPTLILMIALLFVGLEIAMALAVGIGPFSATLKSAS